MDVISDSVNLLHGVDQPTPAACHPTRNHVRNLCGLISAFHGANPSRPVHTAEEAHDELDGGDPPSLPAEIPSVHEAVSHHEDARGNISTTEEKSSEHDVLGHDDGAPVVHDFSASADSLVPPSSRRYSGEDSDSDSDDDLIILVNNEDRLPPSRPGQWRSPNYQPLNSMRSGAKPRVSLQEKLRELYREKIDREEKLRREIAVLKRKLFFFEKNCPPKLPPPIGRPIPVQCSSTERLPSAETKAMLPPRRLDSDVVIQIELQDIDFTTFINEKADKDLKRKGGEGDEEDIGIPSGATTTKMEKKRKRSSDDSKVDDATGAHRAFCRQLFRGDEHTY